MSDVTLRAQVLAEALPYIQKYYGKTIVIKYGGSAMISRELREAVIGDVILLSLVGIHVVVVHGGGPEISAMLKKLGKESRFVDGLRCTDAETMDVVQQVLCGKVNKNLVATLNQTGGRAVGLCGMDAGLFQARMLDEKYGLVGEITAVEPRVVVDSLENGYIPVVTGEAAADEAAAEETTEEATEETTEEASEEAAAVTPYASNMAEGNVVVSGSSSVTPVMEKLIEAYATVNPNATVELQQSDSTTGMNNAMNGVCDIGMASRALKDSELEAGLVPTTIAMDGIAVIVNNENTLTGMTSEQVTKVFTGEITNWADLAE